MTKFSQKTRGGLIFPSDSVITICCIADSLFIKACNSNSSKPPAEINFPAVLANCVFRTLLLSKKELFSDLSRHLKDTFCLENCIDHKYLLIKCILMIYIEIRMYSFTKNASMTITGSNIRNFLTRRIVWAHQ